VQNPYKKVCKGTSEWLHFIAFTQKRNNWCIKYRLRLATPPILGKIAVKLPFIPGYDAFLLFFPIHTQSPFIFAA
jgi:hypothetical protein